MFFRRRGWLRAGFDENLIGQINHLKADWDRHNRLKRKSFDPFGEIELQAKISGAKYVFLLREAKKRNISILK